MYEANYDIQIIQEILGHANINTTRIYLHLSRKRLASVKSPIDLWPSPSDPKPEGR